MPSRPAQAEARHASRGEPVRQFCEREAISRRTFWRWVEKGVVHVSRLAPATGVRARYREPPR